MILLFAKNKIGRELKVKLKWTELLNNEIPSGGYGKYKSSNFEKCYFEIIRSSSFRRLQDKTQVYSMSENDYVRTRLTHSIEVAQIARYIGEQIWDTIEPDLENEEGFDSARDYKSDLLRILECASLLHDIGNPPMGHNGEDAIRDWFQDYTTRNTINLDDQMKGDFLHFEGNAQDLRVIDKLHHARGVKSGMNLCYSIPSVILKYPISSSDLTSEKNISGCNYRKYGYFKDDEEFFKQIRKNTGLGYTDARNPLTYVLEAADDIAYVIADMEDAYSDGIICYEKIKDILVKYGNKIFEDPSTDYQKMFDSKENKIKLKSPSGVLTDDDKAEILEMILSSTRTAYMNYAANNFVDHYDDIIEGKFMGEDLINHDPTGKGPHAELIDEFRKLMKDNVYDPRDHSPESDYYAAVLKEYLDALTDALIEYVFSTGKKFEDYISLIPKHIKRNLDERIKIKTLLLSGKPDELEQWKYYLSILTATDFVSGMTDSYAINTFRRKFMATRTK